MRLICGFLHRDGRPAEASRLNAMLSAQIGAGLDPWRGSFVEGPAALGLLDFAAPAGRGSLPRGESGLVIAADRRPGPAGESDELSLLENLARAGPDGLSRQTGDFAMAAWSARDRSLLLGRDAFGVRPLFLCHSPTATIFASLPAGLFASGLVKRELDESFLLRETVLSFAGPDRSLFLGVERLPPGGWMRVSPSRIERGRYWALDPAMEGTRCPTPEAAAEEAATLVEAAVRRALPSTGPVAAHLSGGLDSAALTIIAARELRRSGRPVLGYSLVPGERFRPFLAGELPGIIPVLDQEPDIDWMPVTIEKPDQFIMPEMDSDQVMPIDSADAEVRICRDAARRGAAVLLSGWGGDEGLSYNGRGVLAADIAARRWLRLYRTARTSRSFGTRPRRVLGEILPYLFDGRMGRLIDLARGIKPKPSLQSELFPCVQVQALASAGLDAPAPMPRTRLNLLTGPGLSRRTEHWAITAAHHGLAVAFPLLDRAVVEFAFSLDGSLFLSGSSRRSLFRDAMEGVLPLEIRQRPEKLDSIPEVHLHIASQRNALQNRLELLRMHPRIAGLFDLDEIARRIARLPDVDGCESQLAQANGLRLEAGVLRRLFLSLEFIAQHY